MFAAAGRLNQFAVALRQRRAVIVSVDFGDSQRVLSGGGGAWWLVSGAAICRRHLGTEQPQLQIAGSPLLQVVQSACRCGRLRRRRRRTDGMSLRWRQNDVSVDKRTAVADAAAAGSRFSLLAILLLNAHQFMPPYTLHSHAGMWHSLYANDCHIRLILKFIRINMQR